MQTSKASANFDRHNPTGLGRFSLYARGTVWMTALAGNLNFIAACFLAGSTAVFTLDSAGARHVRAFFVVCFFHQVPHFDADIVATH